ncbi:amidohydrolase family protein [Roseomonas populi]|uniref:Amidohydrolase family protein n=1 Tax=Roseomonas populi TaxID=3121582 RepID=A0ABT1X4A8_9PROT|nr:amidohydrolase family protein [Roseomonas pecuniae]MCR0982554.1 amidohydrolase family protein [Roseomonas pecuniae]
MPGYTPPPNACDAHCHIWGPTARFPFAENRPFTPPDRGKEDLAALYARLGLTRSVIVQAIVHGTDNRAMLDAIASSNGRYRGIALIDDSFDDKALQALHEGGIRGVRFGFVKHLKARPDLGFFRRTVDRIAPLGWHAQIHLDAADLIELRDELDALRIPFVIDHMGRVDAAGGPDQPAFRALLEQVRRENCWVKLSGSDRVSATGAPFHDALPFARALIAAAPDRVVWGTDFPHSNPRHAVEDDAALLDLLPLMAEESGLQRLLVDNPARLYGF